MVGWNWRIAAQFHGKGRFVLFDTYGWKSFLADGILAPAGASSSFYLPGTQLMEHPLLTIHLLSEYREPTWGQGRRVDQWMLRPGEREKQENHFWDACVGCAVAASVTGLKFNATGEPPSLPESGPKIDLQALLAKKRAEFEARRTQGVW